MSLPQSQYAVELVGPGQLRLRSDKPVYKPLPHQIVLKVEAVGLCFSDLKLLKQFADHPRKSAVVGGVGPEVLAEVPSYRPGNQPTVPGHEAVGVIVAVGEKVRRHRVGERVMVQADWRFVRTATTNAAMGYNFEGALQEYNLFDERIVIEPGSGERYLMPVDARLSPAAVALVEPWACVECSYVTRERNTLKPGGKLLVVAAAGRRVDSLLACVAAAKPAEVTCVCADSAQCDAVGGLGVSHKCAESVGALPDAAFDDIVYFGADKAALDVLNDKLAIGGLLNIVLGGKTIGAPVSVGVGRVHYALTRWIGTVGDDAAQAYRTVPATGELRSGDRVLVVGAGGPMGQMHVIRDVCAGAANLSVVGADVDDARLAALGAKALPLAAKRGVKLDLVNVTKGKRGGKFSYFALMAPVGQLVADAIADSAPGALINIFAGIPAPTKHELDLDAYIRNGCYMFGTSGSRIDDMKIVLGKVASGQLDTNCSVDAVSGMAGAVEGIKAVENRTMAGKIIVYPQLKELGLTPLGELKHRLPTVARELVDGMWTAAAERELLRVAK
jgi:threonine dehydrogenase-like Zn-dependent dehydrogenase